MPADEGAGIDVDALKELELAIEADPNVSLKAELPSRDGWLEQRVELGTPGVTELPVRLETTRGERVLFHVWAVQPE